MKKLFIIFNLLAAQIILAQQVIPMNKSKNIYNRYLLRHEINSLKKLQDTLTLTEDQSKSLLSSKEKLDSSEEKVFIYGFGATDAVTMGNISANGGFSFGAQPHMWDRLFLSIGIGGNVIKKEKQDSVNINSIFFPDNASSVIYAHYEASASTLYHLNRYNKKGKKPSINDNYSDDFLLFFEGSLQNRNIEAKDSTIHNFGIYNLSGGVKYRWTYDVKGKDKFSFDLGIGYAYTEIALQSQKNFQSIMDPDLTQAKKIPTIYRGINCIATVQYNDLIIYARLFSPISVNGAVSYQHNIYFSTGVKITGTFFSF